MKLTTAAVLLVSHGLVAAVGFGAGIYTLPILTAPASPDISVIESDYSQAMYFAEFKKDLADSDSLHWGQGKVAVSRHQVSFVGELAPGPDYKLYLSPNFVETEAEFNRLKGQMLEVGDVKTFNNFIVPVTTEIDHSKYNTLIVWCESFGQFITSAQYK